MSGIYEIMRLKGPPAELEIGFTEIDFEQSPEAAALVE
jgi:hypothetical protein